jgi:hypothetical protein
MLVPSLTATRIAKNWRASTEPKVSASHFSSYLLPFVVRTICALFQNNIGAPIIGPAVGRLVVAERKKLLSAPQEFCGRVGQVCFGLAI